jgi:hypothetical protein
MKILFFETVLIFYFYLYLWIYLQLITINDEYENNDSKMYALYEPLPYKQLLSLPNCNLPWYKNQLPRTKKNHQSYIKILTFNIYSLFRNRSRYKISNWHEYYING